MLVRTAISSITPPTTDSASMYSNENPNLPRASAESPFLHLDVLGIRRRNSFPLRSNDPRRLKFIESDSDSQSDHNKKPPDTTTTSLVCTCIPSSHFKGHTADKGVCMMSHDNDHSKDATNRNVNDNDDKSPNPNRNRDRYKRLDPATPAINQNAALEASSGDCESGSPLFIRRTPNRLGNDHNFRRHSAIGNPIQDTDYLISNNQLINKAARRDRKTSYDMEEYTNVVYGTRISEGHQNWVTAYNMLTGIRVAVSKNVAKVDRKLQKSDFTAIEKFSFDVTGRDTTQAYSQYDFNFKDYAPWVFRHIREIFHIDQADYLMSLTGKYVLSEMGTPGKSGSFFYFSRDYKFIIKTIHKNEHRFLRKILNKYYQHVKLNPNTLVSQFYGLYRVTQPFGRRLYFIVMNNLFPAHRDIHQTFDLKGSTAGRENKEPSIEINPRATLKDLNWLRRNMRIRLGPTRSTLLIKTLECDVEFLSSLGIMDYSLLIGIHDLRRGNKSLLNQTNFSIFNPICECTTIAEAENANRRNSHISIQNFQRIIESTIPTPISRRHFMNYKESKDHLFYSERGGFRSSDRLDRPLSEIYYFGIIDLLTRYGTKKKIEHFWKRVALSQNEISAVPPIEYAKRFLNFIESSIELGRQMPKHKESKRLFRHATKSKTKTSEDVNRQLATQTVAIVHGNNDRDAEEVVLPVAIQNRSA